MPIPYALQRTASATGRRPKFVTCEKCSTEFVYLMERRASGSGTSFLFLDNAGAKERAQLQAKHKVNTQLENEQDPIPCPTCAWVQSEMIPHARARHHAWMSLAGMFGVGGGIALLILDFIMADFVPLNLSSPFFLLKIAAIPVGIELTVLRERLARRYDPNAVDVRIRQQIAAQRAIPKVIYDALLRSAQPPRQKVWPQYDSSRVVWERTVGDNRLALEDDIYPRQGMIYRHILRVFALPENELRLCVTASRNEYAGPSADGPDAHFLRVFQGYESVNLGMSADWADIAKFEERALELVAEHLGVSVQMLA